MKVTQAGSAIGSYLPFWFMTIFIRDHSCLGSILCWLKVEPTTAVKLQPKFWSLHFQINLWAGHDFKNGCHPFVTSLT
jgi:hypothetical protein